MKICFTSIALIFTFYATGQNVGIGAANPVTKLDVNGSFKASAEYISSSTAPTPTQTFNMVNASTLSMPTTDSVGRIYDPGGPSGNYNANLTADFRISTNGTAMSYLEVVIESINLGTGDSLILYDGTNSNAPVLYSTGNGTVASNISVGFSGNGGYVVFKSNADASVGPGFSLLAKRKFLNAAATEQSATTGNALVFYPQKAALRAGTINAGAIGNQSVALGNNTIATGASSIAMGNRSTATAGLAVAIGDGADAPGIAAVSIGRNTTASGTAATAMGSSSTASGSTATALGAFTIASGNNSTAMGLYTIASGDYSTAAGRFTEASGDYSASLGRYGKARGFASFVAGDSSIASGDYSTAMGYKTEASGIRSTAMGNRTIASGTSSISTGNQTTASGYISTSTGNLTNAIGEYSTAMGNRTSASGYVSMAIGQSSNASGDYSTAMGNQTNANGSMSTATGFQSRASGDYSTAMGNSTISRAYGSVAIGMFNDTLTSESTSDISGGDRVFIIGDGSGFFGVATRSSSFYINRNGNAWMQGTLTQNSDARLKTNIHKVGNALGKIKSLTGYNYNWKDSTNMPGNYTGVLAQEVQQVMPELVVPNTEGQLAVNYTGMIPYLIESIKTLEKQNAALAKQNAALEKRIKKLEKRNRR
jgi:hypothetical protein